MKYTLRENVQIESFSDGEIVVYDENNEMMHVLNVTAAMVLNIIAEDEDNPLAVFMQRVWEGDPDVPASVLESDFQNILNSFVEAEFITVR